MGYPKIDFGHTRNLVGGRIQIMGEAMKVLAYAQIDFGHSHNLNSESNQVMAHTQIDLVHAIQVLVVKTGGIYDFTTLPDKYPKFGEAM